MTKPARNQALLTIWGRIVLGAFVFTWLNVSAQPCMMAMEMVAEPASAPSHVRHAGHNMGQMAHDETGGEGGCGHCPPDGIGNHQGVCATSLSADCGNPPNANIDARELKFKLKDAPGMFAVSQAPPLAISFRPTSFLAPPDCVRLRFADGPALNLRYCVFLK
jgi:hypothetical protein